MKAVHAIVADLWLDAGGPPATLDRLELRGTEPGLPSSFRVGAVAQASIAASALAAAQVHADRGGGAQDVAVDMDHACAECRSEQFYRVEGAPAPDLWDRIAGTYRCGDGRWVRIHTNFAHHRDGVLALLGCAYDKAAVAAALAAWRAEDFETEASQRGLVVAMMRSFDDWDAHPHAQAMRELPLWDAVKLDAAPPRPWPDAPGGGPLEGLRVLDLTRILAGPVATRALASHGADVMTVSAAHLPSIDAVIDTGRGKRACFADLRDAAGRAALSRLAEGCDVFVQGYRPGALDGHGFDPRSLARLRPGIVVVSLSAYGHVGPWAGKRGFDSLVQTATGFNDAEAHAAGVDGPKPMPCQILDHGTGFLMALAAAMTLRRQRLEGGSWHVRLSLAQTARWLRGLGRLDEGLCAAPLCTELPESSLETAPSSWGVLTGVRPAARLESTPAHYHRPSPKLGEHPARW